MFIDLEIEPTPNNRQFIKDVTEDWLIFGVKDTKYGHFVISNLDKQSADAFPHLKVEAIASFIHTLQTTTFDGLYTGSRTAVEFFRMLSEQSGIQFTVRTFREAFGFEKFGEGVHNITEFNRALRNYDYVYDAISKKEIALKDRIGRDVQYVIKNAMNADNMRLSIDRSEVYTQVDGYADFEEDEDYYKTAELRDQYTSPMADIIGIKRAETYKNQNIKHKETLRKYLENIVDNSVKFNLSTNFYVLKDYPFAVPMLGDRIRVQDESIKLDSTAKLIKLVTKYNPYGEVYGYETTFGSLDIGQRARASIQSISRMLQDIISGRDTLSQSSLDASTRAMIADFKSAQTELIIGDYKEGMSGIFLVERDDPNRAVGLTSKGVVLTTNGFAGGIDENLAISPEAINASMVRAGVLYLEQFLGIQGRDGWLMMTGDELLMKDEADEERFVRVSPQGGMHVNKGAFSLTAHDGREVFFDGIMRGSRVANIKPFKTNGYLGPDGGSPIYFEGMNWRFPGTMGYEEIYRVDDKYKGRYMDFLCSVGIGGSSDANSSAIQIRFRNWDNEIVGSGTYTVEKGTEPLRQVAVRVDLQAMFGHVPNYRTVVLYCQVRVSGNSNVQGVFRLNRGEFNG